MAKAKKPEPATPAEAPKPKGLRLLKLKVQDFMKIVVAEVSPNGESFSVWGENSAGKSSLLTSIWTALGGGDVEPEVPVRKGAKEANIEVTLGEINTPEAIIRYRRMADEVIDGELVRGKRFIEMMRPDGAKFGQVQTTINGLTGGGKMFDPLSFMRLKPAEQAAILARLAGVDVKAHAMMRKALYDARTEANRRLKESQATVTATESQVRVACDKAGIVEPPKEPVDVAGLMDELKRVRAENDLVNKAALEVQKQKNTVDSAEQATTTAVEGILRIKKELALAEENGLAKHKLWAAEIEKHKKMDKAQKAMKQAPTIDIEQQIAGAETLNAAHRAAQALAEAKERAKGAKAGADGAEARIEACDEDFKTKLAASPLPVAGVTFDAESVSYNGLPLEQAAASVRLRVSAEIAAADNSQCRIMVIEDASLLDTNGRKILHEIGERRNVQLLMEYVSEKESGGVHLVEGRIAS